MSERVTVIGGGLAGCEAAWQLARAGICVVLIDMKPLRRTPAQVSDHLAELVCSNSLRSTNVQNAVGLLKEEMRRLDSLIIRAAMSARVPAGDALAVNREQFAASITEALETHPLIEQQHRVVSKLPRSDDGPVIVATGPLTEPDLAQSIQSMTGQAGLYFYDSIAPIIAADSVNPDIVFAASRYAKGDGDDYLNCPLSENEYNAFIDALLAAECMPLHAFESAKYFEGCLPIEVLAARGRETLRFGAMKPVGLTDPRTGRWPYAVVQLRKEDKDNQALNLVGFQTKLKYPEQTRIFRTLPGLENSEFLRLGAIHRNTFLDSPRLLDHCMRLRESPHIHFAGQITGVEGYVESAAHGLIVARLMAAELLKQPLVVPPRECALGALWSHVTGSHTRDGRPHEPQNVNWAMFPPADSGTRKHEAKKIRVLRAVQHLDTWAQAMRYELLPSNIDAAVLEAQSQKRRRRKEKVSKTIASTTE
ncbi:MAG: methylenetetrahydrofolate--tRNA-(uracil(54)-C(5))-methyltransferase (FADH(2)-oxidizing) TrmFO [Myxococcota bacterium]